MMAYSMWRWSLWMEMDVCVSGVRRLLFWIMMSAPMMGGRREGSYYSGGDVCYELCVWESMCCLETESIRAKELDCIRYAFDNRRAYSTAVFANWLCSNKYTLGLFSFSQPFLFILFCKQLFTAQCAENKCYTRNTDKKSQGWNNSTNQFKKRHIFGKPMT